jgi:C4-type Zn-finger protein
MIAVEVTKGTSLTDYNVGVAFTKELPLKENQRDEVLRYNEELIKKYGLDVTIVVLSDPLDPSALEEEYIIASIISNRETCPDICRRLGCSYDRIRLKVRRQKSNPIKVIKRSSGRPSIVELQAPALGADPRSTIRWTNSVRKFNVFR